MPELSVMQRVLADLAADPEAIEWATGTPSHHQTPPRPHIAHGRRNG